MVAPLRQRHGNSPAWRAIGLGALAVLLLVHLALMQAERHGVACQIAAPASQEAAPHDRSPAWLNTTAMVAALPHASASISLIAHPTTPPAPRTVLNGCPVSHALLPFLLLLMSLLWAATSGSWRAKRPVMPLRSPFAHWIPALFPPPGRRQALLQIFLR